ncbi:FumA C-terminus/TtdB family hydratase beta subunit [Verrucomicrobiota bacterium]
MRELEYPFTGAKVRELRTGQVVSLSGRIFTGRDRLHRYLYDGGKSPVDLKDGAIYHCGPVTVYDSGTWTVRAAGPTTSVRQEQYMARIIRQHRVRVVIGKGGMGEATRKACSLYGCVYLQAAGGAAALLAGAIESVEGVHFVKEFGAAEALWQLSVRNFKAIVTMDTRGRSLHKKIAAASKRELRSLLGT